MRYIKENKKLFLIGLITIITIPLGIGLISDAPFFDLFAGDTSDWIGFWGSYIGGLISVMATFWIASFVSKEEFKRQTENERLQAKENFRTELRVDVLKDLLAKVKELDYQLEITFKMIHKTQSNFHVEENAAIMQSLFHEKVAPLNEYILLDSQIINDPQLTAYLSKELYKVDQLFLFAQDLLLDIADGKKITSIDVAEMKHLSEEMIVVPINVQQVIYTKVFELLE